MKWAQDADARWNEDARGCVWLAWFAVCAALLIVGNALLPKGW